MVNNFRKRIFRSRVLRIFMVILLCTTVIFINLSSVSAATVIPGEQRYWSPISGTITLTIPGSSSTGGKDVEVTVDMPNDFPSFSNVGRDYCLEISKTYYNFCTEDGVLDDSNQSLIITNFAERNPNRLGIDNIYYDWIYNGFQTSDVSDSTLKYAIKKATFEIDPFAFEWSGGYLHNLLRLKVREDYGFMWNIKMNSCRLWYINDAGKLTTYMFNNINLDCGTSGTAFTQSVFTMNYINHFKDKCNLTPGQPVLLTDLSFDVYMDHSESAWPTFTDFGYEVLTANYVGGTPTLKQDTPTWFLVQAYTNIKYNTTVITPTPEPNPVVLSTSFTEFFKDVAVGFFDAELTPGLTLGGIFLIVIIFAVVIGVIKLLL